jgi:ATP-dependent DNA helicase RecG
MQLHTKVTALNRVGKTLETRLKHLGIEVAEDLLWYFPFRYEDFSVIHNIAHLVDGMQVTVKGKIALIANRRSPRKKTMLTEAMLEDGTEQLRVIWFGQQFITKSLSVGDEVYLSGKVKSDMYGVQMVSPSYEKVSEDKETAHTARVVPQYPLTAGITQKQMRFLVSQIIDLGKNIPEWLGDDIRDKADIMPLAEAIAVIHFPETMEEMKHAERRLKFDELFLLQLRAEMLRQSIAISKASEIPFKEEQTKQFVANLPFELTKDQKVVSWEILQDLEKSTPMNRLLEGDVGSGKTVVAALVMHAVYLQNIQSVMMAPTEILARQHFASIKKLLPDAKIGLLTGSEMQSSQFEITGSSKKKKRQAFVDAVAVGEFDILVGTHALLTDDVQFKHLGLVIIDEQHRFGVEQRKTIRKKSGNPDTVPHFLSMTATPIPRSFALTLYGDLDISIIKTMPEGRKPIKTRLVEPHNREKAYGFIKEQVQKGRQVFVICPLIEESEGPVSESLRKASEKKSVMSEYKKLSENIFPELRVAYLHGKMPARKKEVMRAFAAGEFDILVSTSVVEVGVDIPNASVMMIEGADRFGLAQLHQFRGRVGRSSHQSYCFLFTDSTTQKSKERLAFFEKTTDGFALAEYDLDQRGPGDVYGTSQSGMMQFRLATMKDGELIKLARDIARGIDFDVCAGLRKKVQEWEERIHLE